VDAESETAAITSRHGCGVLVPPGDAAALAEAIAGLAADPARRAEMGRRARAAVTEFGRERQVAAVAEVLRDVCGARW
jgi:glycosyltransferase involved in cell wall biosynthesis